MKFIYTLALVVLVSLLGNTVFAQDTPYPTTLVDVAMPSTIFMENFLKCVDKIHDKETCKEVAKEGMKVTKEVAKSASNADRPVVVYSSRFRYRSYNRNSGNRENAFWRLYNKSNQNR